MIILVVVEVVVIIVIVVVVVVDFVNECVYNSYIDHLNDNKQRIRKLKLLYPCRQ